MIKIHRSKRPERLTDEYVKKLTEEFKVSGKDVWNKRFIKEALLKMTNNKCAYCEMQLNEEGKYMNVEHFYPKSLYPDKVVEWDNLLPSCSHCNVNKGDHDTYESNILNPTQQDPKDYLYLKNYRYKSIDNNLIGRNTIDVLALNVSDKMVMPRFKVGEKVNEKFEDILSLMELYEKDKSTSKKNKLKNTVLGLMREGRSDKEYSALVATIIFENTNYPIIKDKLKSFNLWDKEFEKEEHNLEKIALIDKNFVINEEKEYITLHTEEDDGNIGIYSCSAGDGVYIESDTPIAYAKGRFPNGTDYLVKIIGNSMEPLIPDGSYIPIKRTELSNNKICIVSYNGNVMCKKYIQEGNKIILQAINPKYGDFEIDLRENDVEYKFYGEVICKFHNKPYIYYEEK